MERLFILQKITARMGDELASSGFLKWAGIDVPLIWPDIRADIPNDSARVLPVHQDFGSTQCERAWRFWIALRPTSEIRGSMIVYPGTHKSGAWPHNLDNPLMPYVEEKHYAGIEGVTFEIEAGDAVLLNPLVLHASVPNRSDRTKFTLMIQIQDYLSVLHPDDKSTQFASLQTVAAKRAKARAEQTR
jgi:ectoine hydroxylase-related dioxygenase (phytanoyl-CoA dioxygenase family)